jgi:protoporphyrinogen oxidase
VEIFEKEQTTGGLLQSIRLDQETKIEKFYHHFFRNDDELLDLLQNLHISKKIIWRETKTAILHNNLLIPFNNVVDFFRLTFLDLATKFRMIVGMILYTYAPEIFLKQKTAEQAVHFFAGKNAWHNFWNFLFVSKFGQKSHKISAMWLKYRLVTRGQSRDKNKESLGYLGGGFDVVIDILEKEIEQRGGIIHKNEPINKMLTDGDKFVIAGKKFDFCVSTIPLSELQKISTIKLPKIQYLGFVGVVVSLKKTFSPYYWINVFDHKAPFGVIVEQNNLSAVSQNNILYLGKYISPNSIFFKKDEEQIQKIAEKWLLKIEPTIQIQKIKIFKEKYAQPVILTDYKALPRKIGGLYLSSMAHIYPQDRGINYAIKEAREIATHIMKDLNQL